MASGGRSKAFSLSKLPQSDPRPSRGSWQKTSANSDDQNETEQQQINSSQKNLHKEVRINNWDFTDWRPNSASTDSKRRKKSKGNPEREREQSLSLDSPPQRDKKPRTPSSFPRTKIGPSTPTSQRRALENLRSRMTFSETDEASTDGERNNERAVPIGRRQPPNFTRQDTTSTVDGATLHMSLPNRNNNRDESMSDLDSNQIVGRLMQIRDYIKQANTMRDTLNKSKEAANKDDMGKLKKLVDNLKEQERGYMGLLQRMLAIRDDGIIENGNGLLHPMLPDGDDDGDKTGSDDTVSVDLEVQTNASDTTTEERTNSSSSRPYIEGKLGDTDDEDEDGDGVDVEERQSSKGSTSMDNTLVAQRNTPAAEWDFGVDALQTDEVLPGQLDAARTNELAALQQQQNLLKILSEKQEQLRALQGRQDALMAMHKEAERKLVVAQNKENKAKASVKLATEAVQKANNPNVSQNGDIGGEEMADLASTGVQFEQLMAMKNRLEMLKSASADLAADEQDDKPVSGDEEAGRQQLQNKLEDLQGKKQRMDDLLKELQTLRSQRFETLLNGDGEGGASGDANGGATASATSSQAKLSEALDTLDQADNTADSAEQVLSMMDAQNKLEKLQEVKERLDQLRGLVQYYHGAKTVDPDTVDGIDQSSVPAYSDYGEAESSENTQQRHPVDVEKVFQSSLNAQNLMNPLGGISQPSAGTQYELDSQQSDEDNASNNDSQMSSLGPWGDEPEIREKVRQLKATKEKLQQLQDLVAMVQQSPEMAQTLPDNIVELAGSMEEERGQETRQKQDRNISISEGEVPNHDAQSDITGGESLLSVKDQIKELSELKKERERLLAIQNQLKELNEHFEEEDHEEDDDRNPENKKRVQSEPGPVVTFASNDELYSKMRKQRMLREELRSKKKELEAIMKKDRNKRQYFKNQDNQSDTVSYSTDAFGASASADATMATWGGSTVDNLENITETRDGDGDNNNDDDDDAYLSDGIVQVEEEEEENDSDNNTYTIEADARQRRAARTKPSPTPDVRPKTRKTASFPRALAVREEASGSQRAKPQKKRPARKTRLQRRSKQENYRSAEEIVRDVETGDSSRLDAIQQQVEQTFLLLQEQQQNNTLQSATSPNISGVSMGNGMRQGGLLPAEMLQQQMYQQQMMMSMNQCYQQLNIQQIEMQNLQHQLQQISLYLTDTHQTQNQADELTPVASSSTTIPPSPNFSHQSTARQTSFTLNPHFPASFSQLDSVRQSTHLEPSSVSRSPARHEPPQPQTNNLRPIPPPRVQSYQLNSNLNNRMSRDGERDVRAKINTDDYIRSKKTKDNQTSSPRDGASYDRNQAYERASNRIGDSRRSRVSRGSYRHGVASTVGGYTDTSLTGVVSARLRESRNRDGEGSELSLFETLRETIYSEVATLISQNETRPHFLIELFRELQHLSNDYLRQRGLYAVQELVSRTLATEEDPLAVQRSRWLRTFTTGDDNLTASELTPSESFITSDDEQVREYTEKRKKLKHQGSIKNNPYDYTEQVENTSSLSTPSTGLIESPFANESLGDTVIHLDKALERMREMERKELEEGRLNEQSLEIVYNRVREARQAARLSEQQQTTASLDQTSESSVPEIMYSRINSSLIDQQVKQIITEVLPVVKEHVDDVCSPQLLAYIKRLVLSLTRQNDSRQEFTSFFHRQLGSILHDSLARFEGRKVRECGDDLLDDMSDALYDELAFFRMMQDLNQPGLNNTTQSNKSSKTSSPDKSPLHRPVRPIYTKIESRGQSSSEESEDDSQNNLRVPAREEEDLGKERDDELASEMMIQDGDDKDQETEWPYKTSSGVKIELAVSETKPFTRIGSDEDDEDSDESHSAEDPSETAVSRDAKMSSQPINGDISQEGEQSSLDNQQGKTEQDGDVKVNNNTDVKQTHMVNGESEPADVTIDDLPTALNITCSKDTEKMAKEEEEKLSVDAAIVESMETFQELAGDGNALKDPDNFGK
ncbi:pericentriolar material 1 protein isoform X2 [Patella vulgata]|uniref:pericentriolar material 1 protein isoform X2 n=1 Tax=Patella vulgata TaxID=6465 RepID=UPI0024A8CFE6|nr:pericentriolar material 1 protein isoform X2 [Patella vulgata]